MSGPARRTGSGTAGQRTWAAVLSLTMVTVCIAPLVLLFIGRTEAYVWLIRAEGLYWAVATALLSAAACLSLAVVARRWIAADRSSRTSRGQAVVACCLALAALAVVGELLAWGDVLAADEATSEWKLESVSGRSSIVDLAAWYTARGHNRLVLSLWAGTVLVLVGWPLWAAWSGPRRVARNSVVPRLPVAAALALAAGLAVWSLLGGIDPEDGDPLAAGLVPQVRALLLSVALLALAVDLFASRGAARHDASAEDGDRAAQATEVPPTSPRRGVQRVMTSLAGLALIVMALTLALRVADGLDAEPRQRASEAARVQAIRLEQLGHAGAARAAYRAALAQWPGNPLAYYGEGLLAYRAGNFHHAARCLRRAVATSPEFAAAHVYLGLSLVRAGDREEGTAALARGVELDPADAMAQDALRSLRAGELPPIDAPAD